MNKVQTEDRRYVRDIESKALLATDINALHKYRLEKKKLKEHEDRFNNIEMKVNKLGDDIGLIKNMLQEKLNVS